MSNETAVLAMSDIHYGKRTPTYTPEGFAHQLGRIGSRLEVIRNSISGRQIDRLVVAILGDFNDGADIYPTQEHHQAVTNPNEQAKQASELLAAWLLEQKNIWGELRVEAIPGNHGRVGKRAPEAANWDIVAYQYLRLKLMGEIPVVIAENDTGIHKISIRGHRFLLYHGHKIGFGGGLPFAGIRRRVNSWLSTKEIGQFDALLMGHFHLLSHTRINRIHVLTSGTPVTGDSWGLQQGWENSNEWWLFGVSDLRPISWQYAIDLL